ncbi:MAG: GFA family protein, partial [Alphaproteobacteria bacterium]
TELDGVRFLQGEENLKAYKVEGAKHFTQVFCRTCSSLMPRFNTELEIVTIPLGGLDLDPGIRPKAHIFVGNKASWHEVTGDISQFDTLPS